MNERIKELWSQAGGHYKSGNQHTWPEHTIDDPEKFAELIVRECAQVIKDCEKHGCDKPLEFEVMEHFGVKE